MTSAGSAQNNGQPATNTGSATTNSSPESHNPGGPNIPGCITINDDGTTTNAGGCGAAGTVFTMTCSTCSGGTGTTGGTNEAVNNVSGYNNVSAPAEFTKHPVRYGDGVVNLITTDLESDGFGQAWGQTRSWTNAINAFPTASLNGPGWMITQLPYLLPTNSGNTLVLLTNGVNYRYFDLSGGNWVERFYGEEALTNGSPHEYVFTDTTGDQMHFSDFSQSVPANQQGQLKSWVDPNGNTTSVISRTADGRPTEVQRSVTVGSTTTANPSFTATIPPARSPAWCFAGR